VEVSDQLHAPAVLPLHPLERRLGAQSERGGEEKEIPAPAGNQTPVVPSLTFGLVSLMIPKD